jgi:colanic acid/amylovoran biosynthesis glycosyltransferase
MVSRFPAVTETFIVREMNALAAWDDVEIVLFSLFVARSRWVHQSGRRWLAVHNHASARSAAAGLATWLIRRPIRLLGCFGAVIRGYGRHPDALWRALLTVMLAAGHARTMRREGVEHVHAHFASLPSLAAWVVHRLLDVPYSFTAHAYDIFLGQEMLTRKMGDAQFVIAISRFNRDFLVRLGGDADKIKVIHCGIDPDHYPYRPRDVAAEGPVNALCVASLQEYKGHETLLRALAAGGDRLERLSLDFVGDGRLRAHLERLAASLGIADRVRFHGALEEAEVRRHLEDASSFVLAAVADKRGNMDGLPVALMEAAACGLPMVSTTISGIPELVVDGETGLLAKPRDVKGLTGALVDLLADWPAATARAERARELVEAEFDIHLSAKALHEHLGTAR